MSTPTPPPRWKTTKRKIKELLVVKETVPAAERTKLTPNELQKLYGKAVEGLSTRFGMLPMDDS